MRVVISCWLIKISLSQSSTSRIESEAALNPSLVEKKVHRWIRLERSRRSRTDGLVLVRMVLRPSTRTDGFERSCRSLGRSCAGPRSTCRGLERSCSSLERSCRRQQTHPESGKTRENLCDTMCGGGVPSSHPSLGVPVFFL